MRRKAPPPKMHSQIGSAPLDSKWRRNSHLRWPAGAKRLRVGLFKARFRASYLAATMQLMLRSPQTGVENTRLRTGRPTDARNA